MFLSYLCHLQIKSHSEVLGVRTWTHDWGHDSTYNSFCAPTKRGLGTGCWQSARWSLGQNYRTRQGCCSENTSGQQEGGVPPRQVTPESHPSGLEFRQEKGCDSSDAGAHQSWYMGLSMLPPSSVGTSTPKTAMSARSRGQECCTASQRGASVRDCLPTHRPL